MKQFKVYRNYLCIDLKSFYASVECVERGLDIFSTKLVVTDISRGQGAITLAVTPALKKLGVKSRSRVYELPKNEKIIFAKPRMKKYLEYSVKILEVYLQFIAYKDIYVYSIDEVFLDVTNYLNYYAMTDYELAEKILDRILKQTGICATCGIGQNMLISKLALDIESKHVKNFIAKWSYEDLPEKLWKVAPLKEMWGIGSRMQERLNKMGYYYIGDIAKGDIVRLNKEFGYLGQELYFHANGIDQSDLRLSLNASSKSYGQGQTLYENYNEKTIKIVIKEILDNLTAKLRYNNKFTKTVSLSVGYSKEVGSGFSRQKTINATQDRKKLFKTVIDIFNKFYNNKPIRKVSVSLGNLEDEKPQQLNFFDNMQIENKDKDLAKALDKIKDRYGKTAINRAISYTSFGTAIKRSSLIGGHNAE